MLDRETGDPWHLTDDFQDIMEAEYRHESRMLSRYGTAAMNRMSALDLDSSYDEAQALEILAVDSGWLHGERFYDTKEPRFNDPECYLQDFGFGPYLREPEPVFWRSIVEDPYIPVNQGGDILASDFFLRRGS